MFKKLLKQILSCIIISFFISSCVYGSDKRKDSVSNDNQSFFIIDYNVNLFKDKESFDIYKKLTFFDSVVVLSEDVSPKGRINVKLHDGTIGWVEEKYTSYIPKTWIKLTMFENYYGYVFTDKKINFYIKEDDYSKVYHYKNNDFYIGIAVVYLKTYGQDLKSKQNIINMEIQGGRDKKFNWNRELKIGNYQVNYIITTDHPDGGICESFDFAKFDELDQNKYYFASIDYQPYESKDKKLFWRKILFSTLQSLK